MNKLRFLSKKTLTRFFQFFILGIISFSVIYLSREDATKKAQPVPIKAAANLSRQDLFPKLAFQVGTALPKGNVFQRSDSDRDYYLNIFQLVQATPEDGGSNKPMTNFKRFHPDTVLFSFANMTQFVARRAISASEAYPGWWLMGPSTTITEEVPILPPRTEEPWNGGLENKNCNNPPSPDGINCITTSAEQPFLQTIHVADASVFDFSCTTPSPRWSDLAYRCDQASWLMFYDFDVNTNPIDVEHVQLISADKNTNTIVVKRSIWSLARPTGSERGSAFPAPAHAVGTRIGMHMNSHSCGTDTCWVYNATSAGPRDKNGDRFIEGYPKHVFGRLVPQSSGFDGVIFDTTDRLNTSYPGVDDNLDGIVESKEVNDIHEKEGMAVFTRNILQLSQSNGKYSVLDGTVLYHMKDGKFVSIVPYTWEKGVDIGNTNGMEFEGFGQAWGNNQYFSKAAFDQDRELLTDAKIGAKPIKFNFVVSKISPSSAYKENRLLLGESMLTDSYFSLLPGDGELGSVPIGSLLLSWWMDEFAVDAQGNSVKPYSYNAPTIKNATGYLGRALSAVLAVDTEHSTPVVKMREFEKGIVLVNEGDALYTKTFEKPYRRIKGTQSPDNDGSMGQTFTIPANDAIVLLNINVCVDQTPPGSTSVSCAYSSSSNTIQFSWNASDDRIQSGCTSTPVGYCQLTGKSSGTNENCDVVVNPPYWWQIVDITNIPHQTEFYSYNNQSANQKNVTGNASSQNAFSVSCDGRLNKIYRIDVDTRDARGNMTPNFGNVQTQQCQCGPGIQNANPVAMNDTLTFMLQANTPITIPVLTNDSDPNGDTLTVTSVTQPTTGTGTASISEGKAVTLLFRVAPMTNGEVTYTISDGKGGTASAKILYSGVTPPVSKTLTVVASGTSTLTSANNGPYPQMRIQTKNSSGILVPISTVSVNSTSFKPYTFSVPSWVQRENVYIEYINDYYEAASGTLPVRDRNLFVQSFTVADLPLVTVSSIDVVKKGAWTGTTCAVETRMSSNALVCNGYLYYRPTGNQNTNPVAVHDSINQVIQVNTPITVQVLSNDSDPDGDTLTVTNVTQPTTGIGTATINNGTTVTLNFSVIPTIAGEVTYNIGDGKGGTASAKIFYTGSNPPSANTKTLTVEAYGTRTDVNTNDGPYPKMRVQIKNSNGALTPISTVQVTATSFTPFTFTIPSWIQRENVYIEFINDYYQAANGIQPAKDRNLYVRSFTVQNLPIVTVTSSDVVKKGIAIGTICMEESRMAQNIFFCNGYLYYKPLNQQNSNPVAVNDTVSSVIQANTPITIPVLTNDSDPNGDTLTVTSVTQPTTGTGTASISEGKAVTLLFRVAPMTNGEVTYTISDGKGGTASAKIFYSTSSDSSLSSYIKFAWAVACVEKANSSRVDYALGINNSYWSALGRGLGLIYIVELKDSAGAASSIREEKSILDNINPHRTTTYRGILSPKTTQNAFVVTFKGVVVKQISPIYSCL